jgi:hypothetical protein
MEAKLKKYRSGDFIRTEVTLKNGETIFIYVYDNSLNLFNPHVELSIQSNTHSRIYLNCKEVV